ncbi:MAG: metal-dependent transcriptional regulator, partial [Oscillospiraceae bacterium]|nr:metal-dependent transcriptional regulator [Oscillospiraceae bacterium]
LLTRFLSEVLKVSDENSETDACRIEHVISDETYKKLDKFVKKYFDK